MARVALVTGGSSGIGLWTARSLAGSGCTVYTLSRRGGNDPYSLRADVTDKAQVRDAVRQVSEREGRIDILVSCAGFGISGAVEATIPSEAHAQLETNLFGTDNAVRAVLPVMRKQGGGRIVCVSSVAGALPIPFQTWYSVSKAAVNAYVLALQNEVRPFGISVCAVLPGDVHTAFTEYRRKSSAGDDVYQGRISRSVAVMEKDEQTGMSAEKAGHLVARYALRRGSRPLITLGAQYRLFIMLAKVLPRRLSNRIVGLLYGG